MHNLIEDILNWEKFYLSGRLQKPVCLFTPYYTFLCCAYFPHKKYAMGKCFALLFLYASFYRYILCLWCLWQQRVFVIRYTIFAFIRYTLKHQTVLCLQVHVLVDSMDVENLNSFNLRAATSAALLLLPSSFTQVLYCGIWFYFLLHVFD